MYEGQDGSGSGPAIGILVSHVKMLLSPPYVVSAFHGITPEAYHAQRSLTFH